MSWSITGRCFGFLENDPTQVKKKKMLFLTLVNEFTKLRLFPLGRAEWGRDGGGSGRGAIVKGYRAVLTTSVSVNIVILVL